MAKHKEFEFGVRNPSDLNELMGNLTNPDSSIEARPARRTGNNVRVIAQDDQDAQVCGDWLRKLGITPTGGTGDQSR